MRQAGRPCPSTGRPGASGSILTAIGDAALAAELTLQPVRRYGVDAAILFSDIVVPVHAIGFGVDIEPGRGPVVAEPFRGAADLARLRPLEPATDMPYVTDAVRLVARELAGSGVALIGFAGAPFTVASYLIEGGPSRTFTKVKSLMHGDPALWGQLMDRLAAMSVAFLRAQIEAGAQAVQLFDSWAGCALPRRVPPLRPARHPGGARGIADLGVPTILFGVGTGELLGLMATAGRRRDRRGLAGAARRGPRAGSVRTTPCRATSTRRSAWPPWPVVEAAARQVMADGAADGSGTGHIFNLGHGVLPEADIGILAAVVDLVHAESRG